MSRPLYYVLDAEGQPVPTEDRLAAWALLEDAAKRRIAADEVGELLVSTVFLGMDHNFIGGPPILFETMVFRTPINPPFAHDLECHRYATRAEAEAGHAEVVARLRAEAAS